MYKQIDEGDDDVKSKNNAIVNKTLVSSICRRSEITSMENY